MDDPTPMDIDPLPAPPVTYEIVEEGSKRRCKKLTDSTGYSYTFKEKTKTTHSDKPDCNSPTSALWASILAQVVCSDPSRWVLRSPLLPYCGFWYKKVINYR